MVIIETFYIEGQLFNRVYSNTGHYVVRDGVEYIEACDPAEFGRTYTEGDLILEETGVEDKAEAYDILIGDIS